MKKKWIYEVWELEPEGEKLVLKRLHGSFEGGEDSVPWDAIGLFKRIHPEARSIILKRSSDDPSSEPGKELVDHRLEKEDRDRVRRLLWDQLQAVIAKSTVIPSSIRALGAPVQNEECRIHEGWEEAVEKSRKMIDNVSFGFDMWVDAMKEYFG